MPNDYAYEKSNDFLRLDEKRTKIIGAILADVIQGAFVISNQGGDPPGPPSVHNLTRGETPLDPPLL